MSDVLFNFFLGALCGICLYYLIKLENENYKSSYATRLVLIGAAIFGVVLSTGSLLIISLALIAYCIFLCRTNPPQHLAFAMPSIWMTVGGLLLLVSAKPAFGTAVLFVVVAALACLYPFMELVLYGHNVEASDDTIFAEKMLKKDKAFIYFCIIAGLIGATVWAAFH